MGFVYYIHNRVNKKGYVGQTYMPVSKRWARHKYNAAHGRDYALYRAIRKYGPEAFSVEQLCEASNHLLADLEIYYISKFGTFASTGHGYNETLGGRGNLGHIVSDETRRKMSLALKGKTQSGHPISPETRAKISAAHIGRIRGPLTQLHKAKISLALKGKKQKPFTDQHRANLSKSHMRNL